MKRPQNEPPKNHFSQVVFVIFQILFLVLVQIIVLNIFTHLFDFEHFLNFVPVKSCRSRLLAGIFFEVVQWSLSLGEMIYTES